MALGSTSTRRDTDQCLPLEVTSTPVDQDSDEEDAIEVRDGSSGTNDSAPEEAHNPVGDVILVTPNVSRVQRAAGPTETHGFARVPPPPACQKAVSADITLGTTMTGGRERVFTHERSEQRWGS